MKKIFEVEWYTIAKVDVETFDIEEGLKMQGWTVKVTELPQPTKYCECTSVKTLWYTDDAGIKRCCIKDCNKPIKLEPTIERLTLDKWFDNERGKQVFDKFNEIIDWINKEK